jgi:hypothetical protein
MPLRKIKDFGPREICNHPGHNPPTMIVLSPGIYEHTCPACGKQQQFIVNRLSSLSVPSPSVRPRNDHRNRTWS